jgi:ribose transport system substrate-binding protein
MVNQKRGKLMLAQGAAIVALSAGEESHKERKTMLNQKSHKFMFAGAVAVAALSAGIAHADDSFVQKAKAFVATATAPAGPWTGPTTGPKAAPNKFIVYVSNDQRNQGVRQVGEFVEEAAKVIGWKYQLVDGNGSVSGIQSALSQAIALKPDGIVLGGVDVAPYSDLIEQAAAQGIKVDGWHSGPKPGPIASPPLVYNINTEPPEVGKAASLYAIADSDGKCGVVIFTDSTYRMAIVKSDAMWETLRQAPGCTVLAVEDTPLDDTQARVPQLTATLLARFGKSWTYAMGINDSYFDAMGPALQAAGIPPDGYPKEISGGDGSAAAFDRIRSKDYQVATAADPLRLQSWQAVDELNRAFAGQPTSGYVPPVHLFLASNINADGGPNNVYDPQNGYEGAYRKIWGK